MSVVGYHFPGTPYFIFQYKNFPSSQRARFQQTMLRPSELSSGADSYYIFICYADPQKQ